MLFPISQLFLKGGGVVPVQGLVIGADVLVVEAGVGEDLLLLSREDRGNMISLLSSLSLSLLW